MKTKILYVEDEPALALLVRDHLVRCGYEVHWTGQGDEAMSLYREVEPDLCILDIMLPGRSGYDIGREIRDRDRLLPIILLTAKSEGQDVVEGFKAGGNDYLKKSFSLEELMVRMENLLQLAGRSPSGKVPVGALTYDPLRMTLEHPDGCVSLSHRENELLKLLVTQFGEPVERRHLLMQVWGDDHFFNSRNLDVYITRLRKYLRMDPSIQLITLKGVGYQLVVG